MRTRVILVVFIAFLLSGSHLAFADGGDGGKGLEAGMAASTEDGGSDAEPGEPLACDGALCDTSNGAECAVKNSAIGGGRLDSSCLPLLFSIAGLGVVRRTRRGAGRPISRGSAR